MPVNIDPEVISTTYRHLNQCGISAVLPQMFSYKSKFNLNDWDFYTFISTFSKQLSESPDVQTSITWFLLLHANYKTKIAYAQNRLFLLIAPAQPIYNLQWLMTGDEKILYH
ncbi:MAG: hypothetical protein HC906_15175 [Bacteroidales bacterium]|nr:hypothetical protein [Bacteroidales bacterium]